MAIRDIVWTVADNGKTIHPTTPQDGGVQGEHNATRAVWRVGENSVWETPTFKVYVECEDNAGNVDHTEPLQVVGGQISVLLPQAWTQYGGISTLSLVAEEEDGVVAYSVEGYARFSSRQNASKKVDGLMKGRMAQMEAQMRGAVADATSAAEDAASAAEAAVVAKGGAENAAQSASVSRSGAQYFAEQAAGAAGDATSAAQEAAKLKDEIETKLKNGEFKGEKGDKGDKGDSADIAVDTVYNPESPNAQSGLAVAEALEGVPIKYIESPDADGNIVCLRDLESGVYILTGNFKPYWTSTEILDFHEQPYLANIVRGYHPNSGVNETHMQIYNANNNVLRYYKCTNTAYEVKTIYLNGLASVQSVEEMIAAAGGGIIVDDELDVNSTNPVQNKVVYKAIANQRIVNVRNYGAVGDGVTDDTEAIQAALHYAEDNGLPLYIPAGNYLVSKTITTYTREEEIDKRSSKLHIFGAGHNATITTAESFEGDWVFYIDYNRQQGGLLWVHDFAINATVDVSGVYVREIGMKSVLEDLCINLGYLKQETDTTPRAGIYCDQSNVASFQRIKVSSNIEGLDGKRTMNCGIVVRDMQSTKFVDCDIIFCGWALYFGGGANVVVENCRIDENDYGVFQHPAVPATTDHITAYSVSPVTGEPFNGCFKGLTISKNRFEANNRMNIYLIGNGIGSKNYMYNNELTISDNYFTGLGASTAMWQPDRPVFRKAMVFGRCDGVTVERNLFKGKPYDSTNSASEEQNISTASEVLNITIRDNIVPPHLTGETNTDGSAVAVDGNKYISNPARTAWKLFNDVELNQTTRRSVGVHLNYPVQLKPNGSVDVSASNVIDLLNGSIVTAISEKTGADPMTSQEVTFIATGETATIKHTGGIRLAGGVDFAMGQFDTLTLQRIYIYPLGTKWVEKSRSVNRAT